MNARIFVGTLVVCALSAASAQGQLRCTLRTVAEDDVPAPGGTGNFLSFSQLNGADPAIDGTNIAFRGATEQSGGVYASINGQLVVIADTTTPRPDGGNFGFNAFSGSSPSISGENVAFSAFRLGGGGSSIWMWADGAFRLIADQDTPVPGSSGTFVGFFTLDGTGPSISGQNVAFGALADNTNGIYAYINGSLRLIADTRTVVPGVMPERIFMNFKQTGGASPSISGENIVFMGESSAGQGVYAYMNGQLSVIADTGTPKPGGGTFGVFSGSPTISGENVAFSVSSGVYAFINGELRLIANQNTIPPGATGEFVNFGSTSSRASISGENVVFGGTAFGLGQGIWAYIDGSLELIAGEDMPVPDSELTFNGFFGGDGVSPAISGSNVVFSASPCGVYACIVPPPPPIPAVSTWGVLILTLLTLTAGAVILRQRNKAAPSV